MDLQDTPFFTVKLNIKMLPCIVCFIHGVSVHRIVGFDGLGGLDDFKTDALEGQLLELQEKAAGDSQQAATHVGGGGAGNWRGRARCVWRRGGWITARGPETLGR